ncbi:MAG: D-alanine--D-alanine ligase [Gammaproteobacteria bacterium]|nr:D-alanine--D-alanine ligase [Gammaproteobacteria bacterium]
MKNDYKNRFGKVAVLLGGTSGEREVSLRSGDAILKGLKEQSVDAYAVDAMDNVIKQLVDGNFDRAFIALHGKGGEDGVIQGTLETLDIPYTGSGVLGSAIGMDKLRSKQVWDSLGLPVIPAEPINAGTKLSVTTAGQLLARLGMMVMVKPSSEGSSLGMAKAETTEGLLKAIDAASEFGGEVLIEQWINGPEYTVSLLGENALPVVQIQPAREFYDYEAKYTTSGTEYFCPTDLTKDEEAELKNMAQQAFAAINCSGWGRIDFIRNKAKGNFYLLEANTVPGMTECSLVPKAAKAADISFSELVVEILKTSESKVEVVND